LDAPAPPRLDVTSWAVSNGVHPEQRCELSILCYSCSKSHLNATPFVFAVPAFTPSCYGTLLKASLTMALNPRFAGQKLVAAAHPKTLHTLELCR